MEEAMEIYKDMKLIDKDKIVAEIKKLTNHFKTCQTLNSYEDGLKEGRLIGYEDALYKINTLEVKEVDLDKYYHDFLQKEWFDKDCSRTISEMMAFTAKHFFELGLKIKGE